MSAPSSRSARELEDRGHKVCWYTGGAFQAAIDATGAHFAPIRSGLDYSYPQNMSSEWTAQRNALRGAAQLSVFLSLCGSNDRGKRVKARCSIWLRHHLLNRLSNSSMNIANGINRCFGEVKSFEAIKQLQLVQAGRSRYPAKIEALPSAPPPIDADRSSDRD